MEACCALQEVTARHAVQRLRKSSLGPRRKSTGLLRTAAGKVSRMEAAEQRLKPHRAVQPKLGAREPDLACCCLKHARCCLDLAARSPDCFLSHAEHAWVLQSQAKA